MLVQYSAKSTKPKFGTVKYGGCKYSVRGVGPKAFSTKRGARVKSIRFEGLFRVDAKAFSGTNSLTSLRIDQPNIITKYNYKGKLKSVKWYSDADRGTVNKKAFSGCGKSKGAKLKVTLRTNGVNKSEVAKYRKLFTSKGMSKKFKLATND